MELPFACRQGCCSECTVKVTSGSVTQPQSLGLSRTLREQARGFGGRAAGAGAWTEPARRSVAGTPVMLPVSASKPSAPARPHPAAGHPCHPPAHLQGYALMCVSRPSSDCVLETVPEGEAYMLQFGAPFEEGAMDPNAPSVERDDFAIELAMLDE